MKWLLESLTKLQPLPYKGVFEFSEFFQSGGMVQKFKKKGVL